ncbi:hypothetical protein Egran_05742 [Elaphomyces granulatus]|uniref:Peptidase M4 domain-containing protein n=1 Tax=Elaphomyces granulatus TaxID=519963 RepID=A0A232LQQ5_9EURO|nr:hypothetical protein Egran_05742 [Elaphomyces granulatus]
MYSLGETSFRITFWKILLNRKNVDENTRECARKSLALSKIVRSGPKSKNVNTKTRESARHGSDLSKPLRSTGNPRKWREEDDDQAAHECYENLHHRNSINDGGVILTSIIHFGRLFTNANQTPRMVFGDGDGIIFVNFAECLKVVGYGLTHGVIYSTARLAYNGQPAALSESIADIFLPDIKGAALRSMKAPGTAFDDHRTIPDRAFYLVATGLADAGLGEYAWEMAGPIWYESLIHENIKRHCSFEDFAVITSLRRALKLKWWSKQSGF